MTFFDPILRRRAFLSSFGLAVTALATGCATQSPAPIIASPPSVPAEPLMHSISESALLMYRAMPEERFPIPAVDLTKLEPRFHRQVVDYPTLEKPGTVIVNTSERYLYHVQKGDTAMRYGVGIGRSGFDWSGRAHIAYKREWPVWTPPSDMIARQPQLEKWRNGQPPGITNPLGARALYIHQGNRDTLYRLHGTGEAHTIGKAISSGCVRLLHQDIIDLHDRVRPGSTIIVTA
ncbi:MAG: L,D-transpeptidase [Rhizobium sp.]|nr:L,D-transpeptidase [Rhizobium sp.]